MTDPVARPAARRHGFFFASPLCKHVHYLWLRGFVAGCSATAYCPGTLVTRDTMAKFLGNAFALSLYRP
jgi:hypothetical protein